MVMKLKTNEAKSMQFDITVHGVDYSVLKGSLKFMIEGVEYGFPVDIRKDEIAVEVPALDEVIKRGLVDGSEVECKLDVFGDGFYMSPWEGEFKLLTPARVEARMVYSDSSRGSGPSIKIKNSSLDSSNKTIVKEDKNSDKVDESKETEIKTESKLFEGNETKQLLKLLEKLVSERHVRENEFSGDEDSTIEDDVKDVIDDIPSKYEDSNATYPDSDQGEEVEEGITQADAEDGIVAKVKNKDVLVDPVDDPKPKPIKKECGKKPTSKFEKMKIAVERALRKDPNFVNESTKVKNIKRRKLLKALMLKEARITKTKTAKKQPKKKPTNENAPYRYKEPGEVIHESDIYEMMNSVGMRSKKSQDRLIERAKELGNTEVEDIYATIKSFVGPTQAKTAFDFIQQKTQS